MLSVKLKGKQPQRNMLPGVEWGESQFFKVSLFHKNYCFAFFSPCNPGRGRGTHFLLSL